MLRSFLPLIFAGLWAAPAAAFEFESVPDVDAMHRFIKANFDVGETAEALRETFVLRGGATMIRHPTLNGVEKYIYDIDLCGFYIWRWNISADYDAQGRLLQAYVNGKTALPDGTPQKTRDAYAAENADPGIFDMYRPRPEAYRGENRLRFLMFDHDGDLDTITDQVLIGSGPSRPDPTHMGQLIVYTDIDPWRSIFDIDAAARIAPYSAACPN